MHAIGNVLSQKFRRITVKKSFVSGAVRRPALASYLRQMPRAAPILEGRSDDVKATDFVVSNDISRLFEGNLTRRMR